MRNECIGLNSIQLKQFHNQGYVVKEGVYCDEDFRVLIEGLTEAVQDKCDELIENGLLDNDFAGETFENRLTKIHTHNSKAAHEILLTIWSGQFHGPGILDTLRHKHLLKCIEDIIGPNIVATSIYRIRPKVPGYARSEIPWHQDAGYSLAHCDKYKVVTCWIPLVDASLDNGCIWLIPRSHEKGVIRHYSDGHAGYLEIAPEDLPQGAIPIEIKKGSVLFMTSTTPHASFKNRSEIVRWSIYLRFQDFNVPNNINELPEDYKPDRNPVTMACNPYEAYFIIQDKEHPEREMKNYQDFANLRGTWDKSNIKNFIGRRWTPLDERFENA